MHDRRLAKHSVWSGERTISASFQSCPHQTFCVLQPARHTGAAVRAFREHGGKLQRGEPWEAAKALLERKDIVIQALPEIEHPNDDDEDESTPEPPGPRMTRGRSNAEDVAIQRAKQESLAESNSNRSTPETAASSEAVTTVIPPPPFEDKVAILVGLAELVMETGDVAEELKVSAENLAATERDGKTEMAQLEKEWNEQLKEISKKAPSIVSEEYKAWKEEVSRVQPCVKVMLLNGSLTVCLSRDRAHDTAPRSRNGLQMARPRCKSAPSASPELSQ